MHRSFVTLPVALLLLADPAHAIETGITGNSGKQGTTCNDDCHSGGVAPMVRFEGPQVVTLGAVVTFRFAVQSESARQVVAGFNVAASDGVLATLPGQGEHLEADELTHDSPKPNVNGEASWAFTWQAPSQVGMSVLYGAGLSANGDGTKNRDDSAATTLAIAVAEGSFGDANCDGRASAADVTAVVRLLPTGSPGGCGHSDVNGDGIVDQRDVAAAVSTMFELATNTAALSLAMLAAH